MKKRVVISLLVIIMITCVSASFEVGNISHLIDKQYGPSNYIKGWINISLDNEPADSNFEDSFGNSISLIDLINTKINENFEPSCSTTNCASDYSASNGSKTKTFDLDNRESKIIGFKFTGDILSINSINFTIESNADSSCYNQLEIDILNDGTIDVGNNKALEHSTACSFLRNYGCFNSSESMTTGTISTTPYCQRVQLSGSPGFEFGAWIKDSENLVMALYDSSVEVANCELPEGSGEGEISCYIDFLVTESKDYYVCIYSNDGTENSKIRGYSDLEGCGFQGTPTGNNPENTVYEIFAEGKKFSDVGTLNISNSLPYERTFGSEVSDYIWDKYGNLDCSINECVVPLKFISGKNQTLTIKNLLIKYDRVGFFGAEENNFYDLTEIPATVNSDFQKLYLDQGNFSVPSSYGNKTFKLYLNGEEGDEEILSEKIFVESVPVIKSLSPTTTASAFPTLFEVALESSGNITKYIWDFENEDSEITTTNKITYTYNSTGQYELKITVTDSAERSSYKIFDINVGSPKEVINTTLKKKLEDLTNVKAQIEKFDSFYQRNLNLILNISKLENELKQIQKDFKPSNTESKNNAILTKLLTLKIPESIGISKSADSISFYPDKGDIDLDILQVIGGGSYDPDKRSEYLDAIVAWHQKNIETKISFKAFIARYEYSDESVLKVFELQINGKEGLEEDYFFILRKLDDLDFKQDYGKEEDESGEYVYIELTEPQTIVFSTTEDIDFTKLPAFISPELKKLVITKDISPDEEEKTSKWTLFILIMSFLIIVGFVIYIVLQEWYKKKYEIHLFKSKNSLYNLITYIENSRRKGLKDKEINVKLKKAGWSSEQINYVMKKYSGKRTGMFEVPIGKVLNKFKKKNVQKTDKKFMYPKNRGFQYQRDKRFGRYRQ